MSEKPPSNIDKLPFDPARFLDNDQIWDNLSPEEKEDLLKEGARHEIKKLIEIARQGDVDIEDVVDLILANAKVYLDN